MADVTTPGVNAKQFVPMHIYPFTWINKEIARRDNGWGDPGWGDRIRFAFLIPLRVTAKPGTSDVDSGILLELRKDADGNWKEFESEVALRLYHAADPHPVAIIGNNRVLHFANLDKWVIKGEDSASPEKNRNLAEELIKVVKKHTRLTVESFSAESSIRPLTEREVNAKWFLKAMEFLDFYNGYLINWIRDTERGSKVWKDFEERFRGLGYDDPEGPAPKFLDIHTLRVKHESPWRFMPADVEDAPREAQDDAGVAGHVAEDRSSA